MYNVPRRVDSEIPEELKGSTLLTRKKLPRTTRFLRWTHDIIRKLRR